MPNPLTFCIAAEAENDARLVRLIVEDELARLAPSGARPIWAGRTATPDWYPVKRAVADAKQITVRGRPLRLQARDKEPWARVGRSLVLVFQHRPAGLAPPDALVVHSDDDHVAGKSAGLRRGIADANPTFPVVVAAPVPEMEAWYLLGFEPATAAENRALAAERKALSFSPVEAPERLSSTTREPARDCKQVLRGLVGDDAGRLERCLELALARVRVAGDGAG